MGNLDAKRDWGHAKDYVRMQWMMLQQEKPDDFVIATGNQFSVREFIIWTGEELGIEIEFQGSDLEEIGVIKSNNRSYFKDFNEGDVIVRVDKRYFRPSEVESLIGDPSKAKKLLKWKPEISARELCQKW